MYNSIKPWLNVTVQIRPYKGRAGNGDKLFDAPYEALTYPYSENKVVRNWQGVDVVSTTHLYFDASVNVAKYDTILFNAEELPIQSIEVFYRNGVPDLQVVHL